MSALRHPSPPPEAPAPVAALPATSRETLETVRAAYTFMDANDEAVALGILAHRPDIAATLLEALPHVATIFGANTPVMLLVIDEHSAEPLRLAALIETTLPVPEAGLLLDAFYRDWWNGASGAVLGELSFGLTWPRSS